MTYAQQREAAQAQLAMLGIAPSVFAPPLWKLLWRLGIDVPPPLFMGFWRTVLAMGGFFGVFWGLLMWVLMWSWQGLPIWLVIAGAGAAGLLFGLCMALHYRHVARKHRLPPWDSYAGMQAGKGA